MEPDKFVAYAQKSFPFFVENVFSESFPKFTMGDYIRRVAEFYDHNRRTMRQAPKDHFKSTGIYANLMWQMFQNREQDIHFHYFSYKSELAKYHVGKIKELIDRNPFFSSFINLKERAEGVAKYTLLGNYTISIHPHGMLSFKRGIHDYGVIVDDPFQDPANKVDPKIITRINDIFKTQIMDMPSREGFLHVVGTPQTTSDFFFDDELNKQFAVMVTPAEADPVKHKPLWAEWMDWDELQKRRRARGSKIYEQEYNLSPAYSEDAFFKLEQLIPCLDDSLHNLHSVPDDDMLNRIGGWDIGKKSHPAHFSVLEEGKDGLLRQVYQQFFDEQDYRDQLSTVCEVCEALKVDKVLYDATRGELEAFKERDEMPGYIEDMIFSIKSKNAMAGALNAVVTARDKDGKQTPLIRLQSDKRQTNQLLVVQNDLDAIQTSEGHGDCFWSTAMAVWGFIGGNRMITLAGVDDVQNRIGRSVLDWNPM
jgi:hypothetical protein